MEVFLKDNKLSALSVKALETELLKVNVLSEEEKECKATFRGGQQATGHKKSGGPGGAGGLLDHLPRTDVSNEVAKVVVMFKDKNWKTKKQGLDHLESIFNNNM